MKLFNNISKLSVVAISASLLAGSLLTSCDDYLGIKPKKQEIPETLDDYVAFFNEGYMTYTPHYYCNLNELELIGEYYNAYIKWYGEKDLAYIHYFSTDVDRVEASSTNLEFQYSMRGIAVANQIIDGVSNASDCTEADRQSAIASAKILRAMQLFSGLNIFADAYDPATASTKYGIPFYTSSEATAVYSQPTLQETYDFMIKDVEDAVACPSLPDMGATILIPGKGAGYAFLSRLKLYARDYEGALDAANKALAIKDVIYDWVQHYNDNYEEYIANFKTAKMIPSVMEHNFCENYYFAYGGMYYSTTRMILPSTCSRWFEDGDCYQMTNWIYWPYNGEHVYYPVTKGYFNEGGLRTIEPYYIKAECLARLGRTSEACDVLNTVRKKYILPEVYKPVNISSADELLPVILKAKHSAFLCSTNAFTDLKRLNCEGKYILPVIKVGLDGKEMTLEPNHRLWTVPFAQDVMKDENIIQNVAY